MEKETLKYQGGKGQMSEAGYIAGTGMELRISRYAANQSVLITGGSGNGKTFAMKKISQKMKEDDWKLLVFNYNGTHDDILSDSQNYNVIRVKSEGIPLPLLERYSSQHGGIEEDADVCEAIVEAFSQVVKLGYAARYLLGQACQNAIRTRNLYVDDMECLYNAILSIEDDGKILLLSKYQNVLTRVKFGKRFDLWKQGKISVLDFSGYSSTTQIILTRLVMSILWRRHQIFGQEMTSETVLVLDEFQNLPLVDHSILAQILREGRKFKLYLLLATQSLFTFDTSKRLILQQPATKLYFKPVGAELKRIAKQFPDIDPADAERLLQGLRIGECLATGEFEIAETSRMRTLKVTFREKE
ncbi:MAG: ATP-binding protein [Lachnospiraceae bacterium]|nr:ATP-binding protein [Lachnospiraceae bacterium]